MTSDPPKIPPRIRRASTLGRGIMPPQNTAPMASQSPIPSAPIVRVLRKPIGANALRSQIAGPSRPTPTYGYKGGPICQSFLH